MINTPSFLPKLTGGSNNTNLILGIVGLALLGFVVLYFSKPKPVAKQAASTKPPTEHDVQSILNNLNNIKK